MSARISVRRTGLVVFGSRIVSVFTGLVFLVMLTRSLTAPQFGLWEVIIDIVAFSSYPAGLLAFWATRDIARGRMFGKTAILVNLLLSLGGMLLYVGFASSSASRVGAPLFTLLFAILLVPISYWTQAANAAVSGHNPAVFGYSVLISEACKLLAAYPLLIVYRVGIDGVILAVMVANFAQAASSTYLVRGAASLPIDVARGKRWLAHSWLPAMTTLPLVLGLADTFIASLTAGGTNITGYYQAAFSIATIAGYSLYLASALYPLLLKGGSEELPTMTLDLALLFGIPMAFGAAALARPLLYFLRPQYVAGSGALVILAFAALAMTVSYVLDQTLMGRDKVDVQEDAGLAHYLRSNLLFVSLVNIAATATYLALIFAVVYEGAANNLPIQETLELWAVAQLAAVGGFALVKLRRARAGGKFTATRSMGAYLASALAMVAFLYPAGGLMNYHSGTALFAAQLAGVSLVGIAIYFGLLYALEGSFRRLVRAVLSPILD